MYLKRKDKPLDKETESSDTGSYYAGCETKIIIDRTKLTDVLDKLNIGVYIVDQQHDINYINPVIYKEFGAVSGKKCYQYFHDRKEACPWCKNDEVFSGRSVSWRWYSGKKDKYFSLFDIPLNINGQIFKLEFFYDITEQRKAERALMESERRFRAVFDSMYQFLGLLKPDGMLIEVNRTALEFGGVDRNDVINRYFWETHWWKISPGTQQQLKNAVTRAAKGEFIRFEVEVLGRQEETAIVDFSLKPLFGGQGEVILLIAEGRDITEQKRMQAEMEKLNSLNLTGQLAAVISHEIKNPITTIRGLLQVLKDKPEIKKHNELVELIISELDRVNNMASEFLNMSQSKPVNFKKQNLNVVIKRILPLLTACGMISNINVNTELDDIPDLMLDENEIRQLLLNLVRNGIEAMEPGKNLTVITRKEGEWVILSVQDQGRGISEDILDKLGKPFFTTKERGVGLGLVTCYRIAERHGAAISIETSSKGSTFSVKFNEKLNKDIGIAIIKEKWES